MSSSTTNAMVAIRNAVRSEFALCAAGDKIIVACSGGADSLAMSYAAAIEAQKLALMIIGVTIDHQLQSGSGMQAKKVLEQFGHMGISTSQIFSVNVDGKDGMEASARRARYEALEGACTQFGAAKVFLGHTRDDQAESVLLGLARGSGTRSLSAMGAHNGKYIRPLLAITREETVAACHEVGLTPWQDPHNKDPQYLRVRVRQEALPVLETTLGPGVSAALARSAALLRDDADALDEWASKESATMDWSSMPIQTLEGMPRAVRTRVIRLALYAAGAPQGSLSADHVSAIEALVTSWHGQGPLNLPGGVKVERISGRLSLLPPPN